MLLTAYADTDVAIKAINDIGLDYYLLKPWDPPEERLYPVLDDLLSDWREAHPGAEGGLRVVGHRWSERSHEIKTFLARNHIHYRWLDLEHDEEAQRLQDAADADPADLPLVLVPDGEPLRAPSVPRPGRRPRPADDRRAAALRPVHRRWRARRVWPPPSTARPKGCRPSSSSGRAREDRRARAHRSRTTSASPRACPAPTSPTGRWRRPSASEPRWCSPATSSASRRAGRPAPCASTAEPRSRRARSSWPPASPTADSTRPGFEELGGPRRVLRRRRRVEARSCEGDDVYLVGAANSAGQAALNIARFARRVVLLVRSDSLEKSMSQLPRRADPCRRQHRGAADDRGGGRPRRRSPRGDHLRRPHRRHEGGRGHQLAVRVHRRVPPHRLARRRRRPRRARVSSSPARTSLPWKGAGHGRWPDHRSPSRPACRACSPPATCGSNR